MHNESKFFFYKDYQFRSYTESIWGIIFDELEIPFEYEKSTFKVDPSINYLPDFWLPKQNIWIEIKGKDLKDIEEHKAIKLYELTENPVYIFRGIPKIDTFQGPFDQTYIEELSRFAVYKAVNKPIRSCIPVRKKSVTQVLMTVLGLSLAGCSETEEFDIIRIQLNNAFRRAKRVMVPSTTVPQNMNRYTKEFFA